MIDPAHALAISKQAKALNICTHVPHSSRLAAGSKSDHPAVDAEIASGDE